MKKLKLLSIPTLYIIMGIFNSFNDYIIIIGFLSFLLYFYIIYKDEKINDIILFKIILSLIITHSILLLLSLIIKGFDKTNFISLLQTIPYILSAIVFSRLSKTKKISQKILILLTSFLIIVILNKYIPQIISQKIFFNNVNGEAKKEINISKIPFLTFDNNSDKYFFEKDKIIVLDFWNNNCGSCFKKFPKLNTFYNKNKSNKNLQIFSANVYKSESEIKKGNELLTRYNYDFKNIFISNKYKNDFQIEAFPTVIVIKNNEIIFKGTIETLDNFNFLYIK